MHLLWGDQLVLKNAILEAIKVNMYFRKVSSVFVAYYSDYYYSDE